MADFDPDQYLAEVNTQDGTSSFDPDAYLKQVGVSINPPAPDVSNGMSALRGGVQGATLGFADELHGGVKAMQSIPADVWNALFGSEKFADIPDEVKQKYIAERDAYRQRDAAAQQANPYTYGTSVVAGSVLPSLLIPGGEGIGGLALQGTAIGGISSLGASNADLTQGDFGGALYDTGVGALEGGALGAAAGTVGKVVKAVPNLVNNVAEDSAAKAAGFTKATIKKLNPNDALAAEQDYRAIGRTMLDNDVVTPFSTVKQIAANKEVMENEAGQTLNEIYNTLNESGIKPVDTLDLAQTFEDSLGSTYGDSSYASDAAKNAYQSVSDDILNLGDNPTFDSIRALKAKIGRGIDANKANPDVLGVYSKAYGTLSDAISDATESAASQLNDPTLLSDLQDANTQYWTSKKLDRPMTNAMASELGNKTLSLSDWLAGITGLTMGDAATYGAGHVFGGPLAGVAAVGIKKVGDKFGNQILATSADGLSKILATTPETFGSFAPILQEAANRGPNALIASHFILQQTQPAYRKIVDKIQGDSNGNQNQ